MARSKRRKHTPKQIIRKIADGRKLLAEGFDVAEVCRQLQISEPMWHRWLNWYGNMSADDAKEFRLLRSENEQLKKLLAKAELGKAMLKQVVEKRMVPVCACLNGQRQS